jgi:hypothetical protein
MINLHEVLANALREGVPLIFAGFPSRGPKLSHRHLRAVECSEEFHICIEHLLSAPGPRAPKSVETPAQDDAHDADEDCY